MVPNARGREGDAVRLTDTIIAKLRGLLPAFDEPPPEDDAKRIAELEARIAKLEGLAKPKPMNYTGSGYVNPVTGRLTAHGDEPRTYPSGGERSPEYEPWPFSGKWTP